VDDSDSGAIRVAELFPPAESLVPHRGNALFLRRVLEARGSALRALGVIPGGSAFAEGGAVPCYVGLDLAAQAAAALETLRLSAPGPEIGYLVGIREARFEEATLPLYRDILVEVRLQDRAGPLAHHEVRLAVGDATCLSAVLSTLRLARSGEGPAPS
jgi:predicted hotdog family 3-hydroxylacyl-ACP dehydratase